MAPELLSRDVTVIGVTPTRIVDLAGPAYQITLLKTLNLYNNWPFVNGQGI